MGADSVPKKLGSPDFIVIHNDGSGGYNENKSYTLIEDSTMIIVCAGVNIGEAGVTKNNIKVQPISTYSMSGRYISTYVVSGIKNDVINAYVNLSQTTWSSALLSMTIAD